MKFLRRIFDRVRRLWRRPSAAPPTVPPWIGGTLADALGIEHPVAFCAGLDLQPEPVDDYVAQCRPGLPVGGNRAWVKPDHGAKAIPAEVYRKC